MIDLSVVIPTWRRPESLRRALESLVAQDLRALEIIVVDNAPDAAVERLVTRTAAESARCLRYLPEPRLGLHHARHTGVRSASAEILAFSDDDATFATGWASAYVGAFQREPRMAAAGGPVRAAWEAPPPPWLAATVDTTLRLTGDFPILSLLDRGPEFRLEGDGIFVGVNMAIRRDTLLAAGGFGPEAFGDEWLGDGETGLLRRLWKQRAPIGYVPAAAVMHHIGPERMTSAYCRGRAAKDGACDVYARLAGRLSPSAFAGVALATLARLAVASARGHGARDPLNPEFLSRQWHSDRLWGRWQYLRRVLRDPGLRRLLNATRDVEALG